MKKFVVYAGVILSSFILSGCQKKNTFLQEIWDTPPLGNQIKFFDKKYNLTPREIHDLGEEYQRVYEFSEKDHCDLSLLVSKNTNKIYQMGVGAQCGITDDGHGLTPIYDSSTKFKDLLKGVTDNWLPVFTADCLNCGNAFEPQFYMTFNGAHPNKYVDVIFTFDANEGIYVWWDLIKKLNGGYENPMVNDNLIDYKIYSDLAMKLWSNKKPVAIAVRMLGYK